MGSNLFNISPMAVLSNTLVKTKYLSNLADCMQSSIAHIAKNFTINVRVLFYNSLIYIKYVKINL